MTKLIIQADDAAITHATTLGILDSISHGVVRNVGLFTNRPDAPYAAERLSRCHGIDIGLDLNFVTGRPILPAAQVDRIVQEDGAFRSSHKIKREFPVRQIDDYYWDFVDEPFDHDQTFAEADAQVQRFVELMGRLPAYVHHHSLVTVMTDRVLHEIADKYGLLVVDNLYRHGAIPRIPNHWYATDFTLEMQASADPISSFRAIMPTILANPLSILIVHPGYVDAELLELSSYSVVRARDTQLVTSNEFADLLESSGVESTTYSAAHHEVEQATRSRAATPG